MKEASVYFREINGKYEIKASKNSDWFFALNMEDALDRAYNILKNTSVENFLDNDTKIEGFKCISLFLDNYEDELEFDAEDSIEFSEDEFEEDVNFSDDIDYGQCDFVEEEQENAYID